MEITILAIGRLRAGPEKQLFDEYLARIGHLGRQIGIFAIHHRQITGKKLLRTEQQLTVTEKYAAQNQVILLDETGRDLASQQWADLLCEYGGLSRNLVFVIGGVEGHSAKMLARYPVKLRFGRQSWPHLLVRVMLAEQIYRAASMIAGHPYHRIGENDRN